MSPETWQAKYPTFINGNFENRVLRQTVSIRRETEPKPFVWSARLSTGIFGLTDCKSGNSSHAPKGQNEVILAFGDEGLKRLVELGFVPCPTCHPEITPDFWKKASGVIRHEYPKLKKFLFFPAPKKILDRKLVPFDSRRVNWEKLAPYLTALPNRLYVPEGLAEADLKNIKSRFESLGFKLPPVGYYVNGAPWFKEYNIK